VKITVVLIPNDNGSYTTRVPSIPGCISQGSTKREALENIREAIELSLEAIDDDLNLEPNAVVEEIEI
jgi:predicted RNase H-like HicB family nuclease